MPKAASVLSMDISVPRLHRGLQWDSWRDGVFVQALIIVRFWRSSDFRMVNYLRRCSESPAVTVWCLFHYQIVVVGPDDVRHVPCVMTPNDRRRGMFYRI